MSEKKENKISQLFKQAGPALFAVTGLIQVVFAVLWAFKRGGAGSAFYESVRFEELAAAGQMSDIYLCGYTAFVRASMTLAALFGIDYKGICCFIQIAISFVAFCESIKTVYFAERMKGIKLEKAILGALWILTVPFVWHMQFCILPDAVCLALLTVLASKLYAFYIDNAHFHWDLLYVAAGSLLLLGLTDRKYFYCAVLLCFITAAVKLIRGISPRLRNRFSMLVAGSLIAVILASAFITDKAVSISVKQTMSTESGYTPSRELLNRFVYPYLPDAFNSLSDDSKALITDPSTDEVIIKVSGLRYTYDYMYEKFVPKIEEYTGSKNAGGIYREMASIIFKGNYKTIGKKLLKEVVSYEFIPVFSLRYIFGNVDSYYGYNLYDFWGESPVLSGLYMKAGMLGFALAFIYCAAANVAKFVRKKNLRLRMAGKTAMILGSLLAFNILAAVLSVQKFDYRIGLFACVVWGELFLFRTLIGKA